MVTRHKQNLDKQNLARQLPALVWGLPMKTLRILSCMAIVTIPLMADPAIAQDPLTSIGPGTSSAAANRPLPQRAPAPLIGVGLPMVGTALLALLLVRRLRRRE